MKLAVTAAVAVACFAAGWSFAAPVRPTAADGTLGMAMLAATVTSAGTLVRGTGVLSATKVATGIYNVTFNRPVLDCSYVGGIGHHEPGASAQSSIISVNVASNAFPDSLAVQTRLHDNMFVDQFFHVLVICGR